jgi:hypothetical protein
MNDRVEEAQMAFPGRVPPMLKWKCLALAVLVTMTGCVTPQWAMQARTNQLSVNAAGTRAGPANSLPGGYGRIK